MMPCLIGADLFIGGIYVGATGITGNDVLNALNFVEDRFAMPETATTESRDL
jgi:hypothetical protein